MADRGQAGAPETKSLAAEIAGGRGSGPAAEKESHAATCEGRGAKAQAQVLGGSYSTCRTGAPSLFSRGGWIPSGDSRRSQRGVRCAGGNPGKEEKTLGRRWRSRV